MPNTKIILQTVLLLLSSAIFHAALAGPVEVQSIQIAPAETKIGIYPEITGSINANKINAPGETLEITVIAVVFRPDHVMKSWIWKNVTIKAGEVKQFTIPKEYAMTQAGSYKVEFNVYTKDMKPLHRLSKNFIAIDPSLHPDNNITAKKDRIPARESVQAAEYPYVGIGLYGNTANVTGGATMLLWPFKYVGLEGIYTRGRFTTSEGRLLARYPLSSGINPYAGIGYLSVTTERTVDVLDIKSKFRDSGLSGVIGAEIPLIKNMFGYIEISGASIDLKKKVANDDLSGIAKVKYSQVTAGISIVYFLF